MEEEHVAFGPDIDFPAHILGDIENPFLEPFARGAGDDMDRAHVDSDQELGHRDHLIGIADQSDLFAVEILVHIGNHVHQLAPFHHDLVRYRGAGDGPQGIDETIGGRKTERHVEDRAGDLALGVKEPCRIRRTPFAQGEGADGVTAVLDVVNRGPGVGKHLVFAGERAIEHPRGIGKHVDVHPDHGGDLFDLLHIRGLDPAGNDIDLAVFLPRWLGQGGHRLDHIGKAGDMRADVAGGRCTEDRLALGNLLFLHCLVEDLRQVIADRLGQTGGVDGDHFRFIDREDIIDRLQQVGLSAEDRRTLGKRAGGGGNRFFVVAGQGAAMVGAASLRAVTVGQTSFYSQGRIHGADRLTGLGRVYHQSRPLRYLFWCVSQ
ncbi:MAG: hypothetical protein ACD_75C00036G0003 [uncultured bacterium]|nr:MAG: hypothetical protein ACD_75C00036G0003 [uncultured bacterium]